MAFGLIVICVCVCGGGGGGGGGTKANGKGISANPVFYFFSRAGHPGHLSKYHCYK